MKRMALLGYSLIVLSLLFLGAIPSTAQATGTTSVSIDVPSMVLLWYYSDVNVDISAADLAGVLVTGATGDSSIDLGANLNLPAFSPDLSISPTLDGDPTRVALVLRNSWAVMSIGRPGGGNTQVAVTLTNPTLNGPSGSSLSLGNVRTQSPNAGAPGSIIAFPPTGLGPTVAERGDLVMDLDLTNAAIEGAYSGGQILITASNL